MLMLVSRLLCLAALSAKPVFSFTPSFPRQHLQKSLNMADLQTEEAPSVDVIDKSTLTLLEHVNLNIPNHKYAIPFYVDLLGCGLDPRRAGNVAKGDGTVWSNCGASQFHLPFGEEPQRIPGQIGLRFKSLAGLKERLVQAQLQEDKCFAEAQIGLDQQSKNEFVKLVDRYGNVFFCREAPDVNTHLRQPIISVTDTAEFGDLATNYGKDESDCRGIDYVEFNCPIGTAEGIATFYDFVFDATTFVAGDELKIAIIGFGEVNANGRSAQSMLFRESAEPTPVYDGHHVAMYVGENKDDFELAFKNIEQAGVVWINPRFSDKAGNLNGAKKWKQFRFKDIIDLDTGKKIFQLEHEIRSVEHEAWPGKTP
jgi:hypothetical protein